MQVFPKLEDGGMYGTCWQNDEVACFFLQVTAGKPPLSIQNA